MKESLIYKKVSDVYEDNGLKKLQSEPENRPSTVKNILAGATSGVVTTPTALLGLFEAIPRTIGAVGKAAISDKVDLKDSLVKSLADNKMFQATGYLDDKIRDAFGTPHYEDMNKSEQFGSFLGEMLPIIGTGGTYSLAKVGKVAANKAARKSAKKAIDYVERNGLSRMASRPLIKEAKQKGKEKFENMANFLLPGVQIDKKGTLKNKLISGGIQTALPLGINEATRYGLDQEGIIGDYREPESQTFGLITDKRRAKPDKLLSELPEGVYVEETLDDKQRESSQFAELLKDTALIGAGLTGSAVAARNLQKLFDVELRSLVDKNPNETSLGKMLDTSIADRFAWKTDAVKNKLLDRETANELGQDIYSINNNAFLTGDLGDGVTISFSPQSTFTQLKTLKETNEYMYNELEKFIELNSRIQDEANRYNTKNRSKYKTKDYINAVINQTIDQEGVKGYSSQQKMINNMLEWDRLLKEINNDPQTRDILNNISEIGQKLLEKAQKSGVYSQYMIDDLKNNRTIGSLFLFKHREMLEDKDRGILHYLVNKTPTLKQHIADINARGSDAEIINAKNYLDVFEENFKDTLLNIHENTIVAKTMESMKNHEFIKINSMIDQLKEDISKLDVKSRTYKSDVIDISKRYYKDLQKLYSVKELGFVNIGHPEMPVGETKTFFQLLNRKFDPNNRIDQSLNSLFSQNSGRVAKANTDYKTDKNIVSFIKDGKRYFYKVEPEIRASLNLNPENLNLFSQAMINMRNLVQSTMTGKLNPAFAIPSAIMSSHEALTVLPLLASKLPNMDSFSRLTYLREVGKAFKDLWTDQVLQDLVARYDREYIRNKGQITSDISSKLHITNINKAREQLKSSLLSKVRGMGGASLRPYTENNGKFYKLSSTTKLTQGLDKILMHYHGLDGAAKMIKIIDNMQTAIREAPSLGLTMYLGKASGAIKGKDINNPLIMKKIIDLVGSNTANVGREGTYYGLLGGLSKQISRYVSYGNIMIKSLAPKVRASGLDKGIANTIDVAMDLYDPNVRYIDVLNKIRAHSKELVQNKFIQGLVFTSFIPSMIQYAWTYGSTQNRETYHSLSDYDKTSKFIMVNALGPGRHLYLPKDQEVALSDMLFTTFLDNILGMSAYNETDPAFKQSRLMLQALGRSVGVDSIPALDIIANTSGYDLNINMVDVASGEPMIKPLKRDVINSDLSETAYQNGITNNQTTALINSLFGAVGGALLGSAEESLVGSRNDTGLGDFGKKLSDNMLKQAKLITSSRAISSFNSSSKEVYKKQNILNKIASVKEKNPQQQEVYDFIKIYRKNRIKPIHDSVLELRKQINSVRTNGRLTDGSILDYNGRRARIKQLTTDLQQIFAREYHEYENLDKLLEQKYGKGITLENFMEKLNV